MWGKFCEQLKNTLYILQINYHQYHFFRTQKRYQLSMMIDVATAVGMEEPIITPVFPQSFNQQIRRIEQKLGKVIIKIQIVSLTNVKPPVTKV